MSEGEGVVYLYSPTSSAGRGWRRVVQEETRLADLQPGRYVALRLAAGRQHLEIVDHAGLSFPLAAGERLYLRMDWQYTGGRPAVAVFSPTPEALARREMRLLGYVPGKRIYHERVFRQDPFPPAEPALRQRER